MREVILYFKYYALESKVWVVYADEENFPCYKLVNSLTFVTDLAVFGPTIDK